jgi:hypothetical protein
MKSPHQIERQRDIKEAGQQLSALRERWPLAFPVQHQDIRPLALGVAHQVTHELGYFPRHPRGVFFARSADARAPRRWRPKIETPAGGNLGWGLGASAAAGISTNANYL